MIGNFSIVKAVGKFLLGAIGALLGVLQANPALITDRLPQALVAMGVGGIIVEIIDYLHNRITSK